jgi:hypothetical protein
MAGKRKTKTPKRDAALGPSKWRLQHGGFGDAVRSADPETGTPIAHRYAMDTLAVMLGNGTITSEMRDAGEMFRKQFRCAALDTLRAMPLIRIPGGRAGDTTTEQQFQAAARVVAALGRLDLRHLRAQVAEPLRAERPGQDLREVQHADAGQRGHAQ